MAQVMGDFAEVILTAAMPMSSEEFFYGASPESRKEVYNSVGFYIDRQFEEGMTFTAFDLVLRLTGSRTVRYRCDVAFDETLRPIDTNPI